MDSSIDETGSSREKLASFKMISICRKVQLFSYLPIGRIAPFFMLKEGLGITFLRSTSVVLPRPLHFGQAP